MEEFSGSGKDTSEYEIVNKNMEDIINALSSVTEARERLIVKYRGKGWLSQTANPTAGELVCQILERIRQKKSEYRVFMEMLKDIKGLDLVVDELRDPHQEQGRPTSDAMVPSVPQKNLGSSDSNASDSISKEFKSTDSGLQHDVSLSMSEPPSQPCEPFSALVAPPDEQEVPDNVSQLPCGSGLHQSESKESQLYQSKSLGVFSDGTQEQQVNENGTLVTTTSTSHTRNISEQATENHPSQLSLSREEHQGEDLDDLKYDQRKASTTSEVKLADTVDKTKSNFSELQKQMKVVIQEKTDKIQEQNDIIQQKNTTIQQLEKEKEDNEQKHKEKTEELMQKVADLEKRFQEKETLENDPEANPERILQLKKERDDMRKERDDVQRKLIKTTRIQEEKRNIAEKKRHEAEEERHRAEEERHEAVNEKCKLEEENLSLRSVIDD